MDESRAKYDISGMNLKVSNVTLPNGQSSYVLEENAVASRTNGDSRQSELARRLSTLGDHTPAFDPEIVGAMPPATDNEAQNVESEKQFDPHETTGLS